VLFGLSLSLVTATTTTWIVYIHERLMDLNPFPTREQVNRTRPKKYGLLKKTWAKKCRIIVDCTELEIECPSDPNIANLFWCGGAPRVPACAAS